MREYFYNGDVRLDWGFGNPNVTGSLIALAMLAVWTLAYLPGLWGRVGFWAALGVNAVLGVFLIQTFSRGAAVSLLVGYAVLLAGCRRPWLRWHWIAAVVMAAFLSIYAVSTGFSDRTLHGMSGEDKSVTNRWLIYRVIPRMTWDAPEGWGHERAGEAFRQWYQPPGRGELYARLVNSHATWLVEWPWYFRIAYGFGWVALLFLCFPGRGLGVCTPLAVWLAFGLGASFTTIAHNWQLWIIPGLMLLVLLGLRFFKGIWPGLRQCRAGLACLILLGAVWWGWALVTPSQVRLAGGVVEVTGKTKGTHVVLPAIDESVMGKFYGHLLRQRCAAEALSVSVRWQPAGPLPQADACVLAGKAVENLSGNDVAAILKAKRLLLLNPDQAEPALLGSLTGAGAPAMTIQMGSFAGGPGRYAWQALAARYPERIKIDEVAGSGRFLRNWSASAF